jgi:hypothetical protein
MSNRAITLDGRGCGPTFPPDPLDPYRKRLAELEAELEADRLKAEAAPKMGGA